MDDEALKWRVRLLSIPHSGTRFTREILLRAGLRPSVDFLQQHFTGYPHWIKEVDCMAIIPQRRREEVEASWERRRRGEAPINWQRVGGKDPDLDQCYADMERFIEENDNVFLLNVDDPDVRDDQLRAIGDALGLALEADFNEKVGHGI